MVETPMAITKERADQIEDARKASGKVVFVGYMRRYAEAFLRVKELVHALPTGSISYGQSQYPKPLRNLTYVVRVRDIIALVRTVKSLGLTRNRIHSSLSRVALSRLNSAVSTPFVSHLNQADFHSEAITERTVLSKKLLSEALGSKSKNEAEVGTWNLLNGLTTHDVSAMRELIGMPQKVISARRAPDGRFLWGDVPVVSHVRHCEVGLGQRLVRGSRHILRYTVLYLVYADVKTGIDAVRKYDCHIEVYTKEKHYKVTYDT
jgi:hypothetical protein